MTRTIIRPFEDQSYPGSRRIADIDANFAELFARPMPLRSSDLYALWGDSRAANGSALTATTRTTKVAGFQHWLGVLTGQRVRTTHELNFAVAGYTTALSRTQTPTVVACEAPTVIVLVGTNSANVDATTAASAIADLQYMRDALLGANKRGIFIAELPRGDSTNTSMRLSATNLPKLLAIRQEIMSWNGIYPGIYAVDPWPLFADYTSTLGDAKAGLLMDGLHPGGLGGYTLAKALQPLIEQLYPAASVLPHTPADVYDATSNPRGSLCSNSMMTGTSGTMTNGATGSVATGFALMSNASVTVAGSKVTDADGYVGQRVQISGTTTTAVNIELRHTMTAGNFAQGDVIEAVGRADVASGASGVLQCSLEFAPTVNATFVRAIDGNQTTGTLIPATAYKGTLRTPRFSLDAAPSASLLRWYIALAASSTISFDGTFYQTAARKVI